MKDTASPVWLSLGSNLGDRYENLIKGLAFLRDNGLSLMRNSGVYETEPVGYTDQPAFFNITVQGTTSLDPHAFLAVCQKAEEALGRKTSFRWGPRTLDVDILLYDDLRMDLPELTIPHPRMAQRAFVLAPLEEMDPDIMEKWRLPSMKEGTVLIIPAQDVTIRMRDSAQ